MSPILALLSVAAALSLQAKPAATAKASPEDAAAHKLEKVEKGFAAMLKASPVLEDLVGPMLKEVHSAIESKKMDSMKSVLAEFPKWQQQMTERQKSIMSAGDDERTTLLVAVLQNKQSLPVSEQLDVAHAADFSGLPVVAYIEEHNDEKTPLVNLALKFLDGKDAAPVNETSAAAAPAPKDMQTIIDMLATHKQKAEQHVKALEAHRALVEKVLGEKSGKNQTMQVKYLKHREERKLDKELAIEKKTVAALGTAMEDIKNKDMKGLKEAKQALQDSVKALEESEGQFLHFLQIEAPGFSCPYCGAQCIEKCRATEHKSMSGCLTECLAKNPVGPQ
jgi:hypothetical protein